MTSSVRLGSLVAAALLTTGCGLGEVSAAADESDSGSREAADLCEEWMQADVNRGQLVEFLVRSLGGDPSNQATGLHEDSWVIQLAGSPFYGRYYATLAELTPSAAHDDLSRHAAAYASGPDALLGYGVEPELVDGIAAAYGGPSGRPDLTADVDGSSLVGLRVSSLTDDFALAFDDLPADIDSTVDLAVSRTRDRCRSMAG